jgi:hypothetical protein
MAELRLMLIALASCAASEAAPPPAASASNFAAPKGWAVDTALAKTAATAAGGDKVTVLGSDAWSEPSRGCYAIWIDLAGGAVPIDAAADQLIAAMTTQKATLREIQKPAAGDAGTLALAFDRAPYHGKLRAELVNTGEVRALACMWNQREPKACEAGCAGLLGAMK